MPEGAAPQQDAAGATGAPRSRPGGEAWDAAEYPQLPAPELWRRLLGGLRLILIALLTAPLLILYLAVKALSGPVPALGRLRPLIAGGWARAAARLIGLRIERVGRPMRQGGALVANHSSWSDILVLMGAAPITFVSKAEVRDWPGIGFLAQIADTMFIARKRAEAKAQNEEMRARIESGQQLLFFPEGTSTDALRVIPFKTTLFAVFFAPELHEQVWVQPVSVVYRPKAGGGRPREFYGWWGDMDFGPHIWALATRSFGGRVEIVFHSAVRAADFRGRKELAAHCDRMVREGLVERLGPPPEEIAKG